MHQMGAVLVVARRGRLNFLELELDVAVSHHVGARKRTRVFWKSSQCSVLSSSPALSTGIPDSI